MQRLSLLGKALYDPDTRAYYWRELFPEFDPQILAVDPILAEAQALIAAGAVTIDHRETTTDGGIRLTGQVAHHGDVDDLRLERDSDGRVIDAACTCTPFNRHQLRHGPCRHVLALGLADDRWAAAVNEPWDCDDG